MVMASMNISDIMKKEFLSFQVSETISSAAKKMEKSKFSEVPVLHGWKFAGMFRLSDLAAAVVRTSLFKKPELRKAHEIQNQTVGRYARARGVWLKPDSDIISLFIYLKRQNAEMVPVVDQQMRLVGVVYASDARKRISRMLLDGSKAPIHASACLQNPECLEGQTPIDQLVHLVEKKGSVRASDAARLCSLSRAEIEDYAKSLEKSNLIRIEYDLFGMKLVRPEQPRERV
jgi:predicted transcriptional regulator